MNKKAHALFFAVILMLPLACKKAKPCQATVTLNGKSATAPGSDKPGAENAACAEHCTLYDPTVDGKHRVWKMTGGVSSGDKAKDLKNVGALKRIQDACVQRCSKAIASESARVSYQDCEG